MRVTILGIDGLEYDFVEELDLNNLKQNVYGKLSIPDECCREEIAAGDRVPWTPLCWMTILTGALPPEKYQQHRARLFRNPILEGLRWRIGKYFGFIQGKRKFIHKIGFKGDGTSHQFFHGAIAKNMKTIFNLVEKMIDFNVPTYSDTFTLKPFNMAINEKELLPFVDEEHELMKRFVLSVIEREAKYNLFMAYTRVLDFYGHLMYRTESFYHRYRMMDLFIHEFAQKVEGLLLIISDHGFVKLEGTKYGGKHSNYAFYSMNIPIDIPMNSLLDIYPLVKKALEEY